MIKIEIITRDGIKNHDEEKIKSNLPFIGIKDNPDIRFKKCYYFSLDNNEIVNRIVKEIIIDPIIEEYTIVNNTDYPLNVVEYGYMTGVMDPVILTLNDAIERLGIIFKGDIIRTFRVEFSKNYEKEDIDYIAKKLLINGTVQYRLNTYPTFKKGKEFEFKLIEIDIANIGDDNLMDLSNKMVLSLNINEMKEIQKYYNKLNRKPTDIELETIAQTWSEHCKHKTLNGNIDFEGENINGLLKSTIFKATKESKRDFLVSVFKDNAGIIKFDDKNHICFKVETHNHPSALEPYGGAETGIGGVVRDIMGTGKGAKPIANTDVFCFANPDYPHTEIPIGILHPKRIAMGVVAGVRDYGNRMGIPTVNGSIHFHNDYLGNPVVFCGSIGIMPVGTETKHSSPGEKIVVIGGRTGKDGIHGATFSSISLNDESEAISSNAVQIGNAITEKKMLDALLEARDKNLYTAITDCGAGGLSSAIGEMGENTGAFVELSDVLLKYKGLTYTEIWISEAQERMVISVKPENINKIRDVFKKYNVEYAEIGEFTNGKNLVLFYKCNKVLELDMEFLHNGLPKPNKKAIYKKREQNKVNHKINNLKSTFISVLNNWTIASKEWVIRQYDHEVQGRTVGKPLIGEKQDAPSDAAVIKPEYDSLKGIVISNGINVRYGITDPYKMALCAIDEAIRNLVCVGGNPDYTAILDNYSFGNPDKPEILGDIVMASKGLYDAAKSFDTPFISGKDSLYNEFKLKDKTINIPPTILISALSVIDDVQLTITSDIKSSKNPVYLIGNTHNELGGSILYDVLGISGGIVPNVDVPMAQKIYRTVFRMIQNGYIVSAHDSSEGGISIAATEMAIGGRFGLDFDLSNIPFDDEQDFETILFSESTSRILVEVKSNMEDDFINTIRDISYCKLGYATFDRLIRFKYKDKLLEIDLTEIIESWKSALRW
ncbi:phosphoribosylformylglycinamidine synthase subunit PurL [candidate division WOR-3 bacterium]|nr:phosphoribosylformylglycinamidine synthase subunit PurL [candidate division WOR-3 bacterium]